MRNFDKDASKGRISGVRLIHIKSSAANFAQIAKGLVWSKGFDMRITKRSNIAIRVLMFCGANAGRLVTKSEVAQVCNTSENHLAQVINRLGQLDYLKTQRGRGGGIMLARPMSEICIGAIFRELESHVPIAECFADVDNSCPLVEACRLKQAVAAAAEAFYAHLDEVSLDALVCDNKALHDIMVPAPCSGASLMAEA